MSNTRELKILIKADGSIAVEELKRFIRELKGLQTASGQAGKGIDNLINRVAGLGRDTDKTGAKLGNASRKVKDIGDSAKESSLGIQRFKDSWQELSTPINQTLDLLAKAKRGLDIGWEVDKQAAKFQEAKESFTGYASSVGSSSEEMLSKLRAASGGTIDDFTLIKTASLGMALGVTKDADKMANLMQIARKKARLFGIETKDAFDDLVTGIGRASPQILDNLGIRIPAGFEQLTDGMSDADKVAKLFEMTLEAGNEELEAMGGLVDSRADKMRQLETSFTHLKLKVGELVGEGFQPYVEWLNESIKQTNKLIDASHNADSKLSQLKNTVELTVAAYASWKLATLAMEIAVVARNTEWAAKAQLALNGAMSANPYALAAIGLGVLGTHLYQLSRETEDWNKYTEDQIKSLEKLGHLKGPLELRISFLELKKTALGSLNEINTKIQEIDNQARESARIRKRLQDPLGVRPAIAGQNDPGSFEDLFHQQHSREAKILYTKKAELKSINAEIAKLKEQVSIAPGAEELHRYLSATTEEYKNWAISLFKPPVPPPPPPPSPGLSAKEAAKEAERLAKAAKSASVGVVEAIKAIYAANRNVEASAVKIKDVWLGVTGALEDAVNLINKWDVGQQFLDKLPFTEAASDAAELANSIGLIQKAMSKLLDKATPSSFKPAVELFQRGMMKYVEATQADPLQDLWDSYGGNVLSTVWQVGSTPDEKKTKNDLSKTIAEAVTTGFANADFSNFSATLGSILSDVLSRSVSAKFPVLNAGGGIDFGNLATNVGVSLVTSYLTRPGRFFGGREEHGKAVIEKATDLKGKLTAAYLESFKTELLPYIAGGSNYSLLKARGGIFGVKIGYHWNDSGDGVFSDKTRTYGLVDQGASSALEALTKAIENSETYNREMERSIEVLVAGGKDFEALQKETLTYQTAVQQVRYRADSADLNWSDGTSESVDLSEDIHNLIVTSENLTRQLGQANAESTSIINQRFTQYAPWLDTIPFSAFSNNIGFESSEQGKRQLDAGNLSQRDLFEAFTSLQTNNLNRRIPLYLLDMVKQTGTNKYELESLKYTDEDAYTTKYLSYLEKQEKAYEEVMKRSEKIFDDLSKTFEERSASLENFERAMDAYHQTQIEQLRIEKEQQDEKERMMAEQNQAQLESALSLVGELQQRQSIAILQGGDAAAAIREYIDEFASNPEVVALLQSALASAEAKARWG